ncbi:MAG: hypothetical protein ACFFAO_13130 [Candidatus Hermodarchaeota archaeon]
MKKNQIKCVVCGGNITYNKNTENYQCIKCNTDHSSEVFAFSNNAKKSRLNLSRIRIVVAVLGSLYLLFILYRWIIY